MTDRFYIADPLDGPTVELLGSESHYLMHVLRRGVGDRVTLFNGKGTSVTATVERLSKKGVELSIVERRPPADDRGLCVTLATAVPKGERFRWLVEKATELGVDRLIPLETQRSVVRPGRSKLETMRQTVIAACKQSGRDRIMEIDAPRTWQDLLESESAGQRVYVAHPGGSGVRGQESGVRGRKSESDESDLRIEALPDRRPVVVAVGPVLHPSSFILHPSVEQRPVLLVVGPEGGLTDDEIAQAVARGATLVNLGPHTLRIETAALAMAVLALSVR